MAQVRRLPSAAPSWATWLSGSPADLARPSRRRNPSASQPLPPEALAVLHELKARHMREWLDTPVPALGGKTPRSAAKNKAGRAGLDVLLREIELMESQAPPEMRGDIGWLRRELGME